MPREVIKTIKGRRYRYSVESRRDAETGRRRAAWTYLGPLEPTGKVHNVRPRGDVRARIVAAVMRLLEHRSPEHLTVSVIAREAGVGVATFYRHFPSRIDAFDAAGHALLADMLESSGYLTSPLGSRAQERSALRGWLNAGMREILTRPAAMHVFALVARSRDDQPHRAVVQARLAERLGKLDVAGIASVANASALANAIVLAIIGVFRGATYQPQLFDQAEVEHAILLADRAIFGA
jgi:AcrR family transcriptional regulator